MRVFIFSICILLMSLTRGLLNAAAPEAGDAVFEQRCAACHEQTIPGFQSASNYGAMIRIACTLSMSQRRA